MNETMTKLLHYSDESDEFCPLHVRFCSETTSSKEEMKFLQLQKYLVNGSHSGNYKIETLRNVKGKMQTLFAHCK